MAAKKAAADAPPKMTTYILESKGGNKRKVTVPSSWKVTFGPLYMGKGQYAEHMGAGCVLRFYEGNKENQRAVFANVTSFRDAALEIEEQVTTVKRETVQKAGPGGGRAVEVEAKVTEWRNPDAPQEPSQEYQQIDYRGDDDRPRNRENVMHKVTM